MKNVNIPVPESSVMQAIADPQYIFSAANQFLVSVSEATVFKLELVGAKKKAKLNDGFFSKLINKQLNDVKKTELVLIPALSGDTSSAILKKKSIAMDQWAIQECPVCKFDNADNVTAYPNRATIIGSELFRRLKW